MRILCMSDSVFNPTGLGRLGRELVIGLSNHGHEMGYIGWFHRSDVFPSLPNNIQFWSTNNNLYGSDILDSVVMKFQPDVVLTIGDLWNLWYIADPNICKTRRQFQWANYQAVDGEPIGGGIPPRLVPIMEDVDIPVAYTEYSKQAILKSSFDQELRNRLQVIYHGVNTDIFKPDPAERMKLRKQYQIENKFVFLSVFRNQSRKNTIEVLKAWKKFSELPETKGKIVFWPHTFFLDSMGWNIDDLLGILGLRNNSIMYYDQVAHGPSELHLIPENELAYLYQLSDAFILISGEGFGMPTFEAMATGLPCILLDYAASSELGADGRAVLVPRGDYSWTGMHLTERPIPAVDDIVAAMLKMFRDFKFREETAKKGYDFAVQYPWSRIVSEWNLLFSAMQIPFIKPINLEVVV